METEKVYQSIGIISSWEEMLFRAPMPLMVDATLIPFRDSIISDGLVMPYNIYMGPGMRSMFENIYMTAKKNGQIISKL
jgi:hypothetical protein